MTHPKPEMVAKPAECWSGCDDPECPYTHSPTPAQHPKPAQDVEQGDFDRAFSLIFETYNKPADQFHDYEAWALWQHRQIILALRHMQKARTRLASSREAELERKLAIAEEALEKLRSAADPVMQAVVDRRIDQMKFGFIFVDLANASIETREALAQIRNGGGG